MSNLWGGVQTDLFTAMQDGIDRADEHANRIWKQAARDAVKWLATKDPRYPHITPRFSSDDVWGLLKAHNTHEPRAMGAIMQQAVRDGWIVSTGKYEPSTRPESHRRPVLIWRGQL